MHVFVNSGALAFQTALIQAIPAACWRVKTFQHFCVVTLTWIMYATKVITPSKRNIRERSKVFLLLFSASVSWKACARKKINKMEYTDSDCYVHKPTHKPTFIWRNMLALNSRGIYSRSWNPPALNFLLKARMQSSFLFSLHLTNSFLQLQLFLLSSTRQVQSHWDLPLEYH